MENSEYFDNGANIFDIITTKNCLCSCNGALDVWQKLFYYSFGIPNEHKLDCQVLCLSIARHTAEVFICQASHCNTVCCEISEMLKLLMSDDLWGIYVKHFQNVEDLHLQWIFMKSIDSILYSSSIAVFKMRVNELLEMLKGNLLNEVNLLVLQLLSSLVDYNIDKCVHLTKSSCQKSTACSVVPYKEMLCILYDEISLRWSNFLIEFHAEISSPVESRKKSTTDFLFLWNTLSSKNLSEKCISRFYNQDTIVTFFTSFRNLPLTSLTIYADVIFRMFNLDLQNSIGYKWDASEMEKIILSSVEKDFLLLQSHKHEASDLSMNCSKRLLCEMPAEDVKCDNTFIRKILCIYFRILSELKNELIVCEVLSKLISCMKNFVFTSSKWSVILNYFIEDDELLFHIMLSTLRIYVMIKKSRTKDLELPTSLKKEANPHYMFVVLLKKLGFDHNELISFLTSDETCFLLYLLQYLKLLANEWNIFVHVHMLILEDERKGQENDEKIKQTLHPEQDAVDAQSLDVLASLKPVPHLVPYIDSSDDECESTSKPDPEKLDKCVEKSVMVLIHLKVALQRLTEINEFPYNIAPLISLLQECESKWLLKE